MKPNFLLVLAAPLIVLTSAWNIMNSQKKPWPVPDAAKNKKNPVVSNAESIASGKSLWATHCKSCHGAKGLGDGTKASQLNTEPGDFSKNDFHAQTDGSLFYKTSEGRDDMPAFKRKIPNANDIWALVNYMRTMKKGGAPAPPPVITTKDTVTKKTEKPSVVSNPAVKKDSTVKKEIINPVKPETPSLQEQINRLNTRVDSVEKALRALKEKTDTLQKR